MGRILAILLFIVVIGFGLGILATYNEHLSLQSPLQTASVIDAVSAISTDFNETGTLVFYPNNVGPVPYLFYQDATGHTVAKALVFSYSSGVNSSWAGARINITGRLTDEHVVVSRVDYLSGP